MYATFCKPFTSAKSDAEKMERENVILNLTEMLLKENGKREYDLKFENWNVVSSFLLSGLVAHTAPPASNVLRVILSANYTVFTKIYLCNVSSNVQYVLKCAVCAEICSLAMFIWPLQFYFLLCLLFVHYLLFVHCLLTGMRLGAKCGMHPCQDISFFS